MVIQIFLAILYAVVIWDSNDEFTKIGLYSWKKYIIFILKFILFCFFAEVYRGIRLTIKNISIVIQNRHQKLFLILNNKMYCLFFLEKKHSLFKNSISCLYKAFIYDCILIFSFEHWIL